jgi:hypothetical protein
VWPRYDEVVSEIEVRQNGAGSLHPPLEGRGIACGFL